MAVRVKLETVIEGLECQVAESYSFLNKNTGEIVLVSEDEMRAAEDDEDGEDFPEWERDIIDAAKEIVQDRGGYIQLPTKFDIDEYRIMKDFCCSLGETDIRDDLLSSITGCGAFSRFRDAIYRYDISDRWYEYRSNEFRRIAIDWCKEHGIECEEE